MRRVQFQKKIKHYLNVRSFFEGAAISFFMGSCLFLDVALEVTLVCFVFFILACGICYVADTRAKFYQKSLYYYNKRQYLKPITIKLAA